MSDYAVSPMGWGGCFLVPADVVDRHLKLASPDAIRVLLYLLRFGRAHPDVDEISAALGLGKPAVTDALDYWVADGLLTKETTSGGIVRKDEAPVFAPAQVPSPVKEEAPAVIIKSGKMPSYSGTQIRDAMEQFPQLRPMFLTAEELLARPLTNADINLLYGLFDWYGLPVDVVELVLYRCHANGKMRPAAIKDEAENFYKHGAVTKESAESFASELDAHDAVIDETASVLRITDHAPYAKERRAFETWHFTYGFDTDLIAAALELALKNTEGAVYTPELLPYLNKIMQTWFKGGIKTAEDARSAEQAKTSADKKPSAPKKDHSFDLEEEAALAMQRFSGKK